MKMRQTRPTECECEARMAEAPGRKGREREAVLGKGAVSPSHQLGVCGTAVSSPSGIRDGASEDIDSDLFLLANHPTTAK